MFRLDSLTGPMMVACQWNTEKENERVQDHKREVHPHLYNTINKMLHFGVTNTKRAGLTFQPIRSLMCSNPHPEWSNPIFSTAFILSF